MSKQRNREEKLLIVPLYSGPVKVLAISPFGAGKDKPPVELVVANWYITGFKKLYPLDFPVVMSFLKLFLY